MLHINDITWRIGGRTLLDEASASIPSGHKVGLVGRNGCGKSTLLKIIAGELEPEGGSISLPKGARKGMVRQEAPEGKTSLIDWVVSQDLERANLLAEADTATDGHRIADIHTRLQDINAHSAPARAASILAGLGFDNADQQRSLSEFSGGWRMRVALAALLFTEPDLLLLDEPTNYLDLEGTLWITAFLRNYPRSVVVVSHDRDLLNTSVQGILHLDRGKLDYTPGSYDRFETLRRERQALQLSLKKKQDDACRHMEAYVNRFRAQANKARQAQSRLKALARLQPIAAIVDEHVAPFVFEAPQKPMAPPLLRLDGASVGYEPGKPVLTNLDLRIDPDDRIGLLGANGNGKSTFAKLLTGKLDPMSGRRKIHKKARIGYFAQHQMDELSEAETPYDHIRALMPEATEAQLRAKLGHLGFGIDKAETRTDHLSGGEKARLLFALAGFGEPHMLILDEPTNHLDVDSREALIRALNEYEGAVILISHDRHLIETCADRLWLVGEGTVSRFEGDMDD
ncbi:MAG TPA: ABC-F family ATP-binding cassette domain-containing protein, partial [Rhizobiales bacterium]|nr:ABC-F family ATP-binding cassette domain-containing protein [Hyphomicrobiales bacterium]